MSHSFPRSLRIGSKQIMLERVASLLKPSQWHWPSSMEGAVAGERLYWFGPLHVAIGPWHP